MAKDVKIFRRAFNAGELSKRAKWRNDFEKHAMACEELENFYVSPLGDIVRRKGTYLLRDLTLHLQDNSLIGEKVRILPFEYNAKNSYLMAFHCQSSDAKFYDYKVSNIKLPAKWSLRVPLTAANEEFDVLKLGNLKVVYTLQGYYVKVEGVKSDLFNSDSVLIHGDGTRISVGDTKLSAPFRFDGSELVYRASEKIDFVNNGDVDNRLRFVARSPIGLENNGDSKLRSLGRARIQGNEAGFIDVDDDGNISVDIDISGAEIVYEEKNSCNSQLKVNGDECSFVNGIKWDSSYNDELLSYPDATLGEDENAYFAKSSLNDFTAFLETFVKAYGFTQADVDKATIDGKFNEENIAYSTYEFALLRNNNLACELMGGEAYGGYIASVGYDTCVNLFFWKQFIQKGIAPIAFDIIKIPFYIPVGCKINIADSNADNSVKVYGYAKNGDIQALDGSHTSDIEYLLVVGGIGAPAGESVYTETNCIAGTEYLQNQIDAGKWISDNPVKLSVFDVNGGAVCSNIELPILSDVIDEFQFKQVGGWVYLVHDSFAPVLLKFDGEKFDVGNAVRFFPTEDTPLKQTTLYIQDGNYTLDVLYAGQQVVLSSKDNFFTNSMVGSQIKVDYLDNETHTYKWKYSSNYSSYITNEYAVIGEVKVVCEGGIWDGLLLLEESTDNGVTWHEIGRTTSIQGSSNEAIAREIYNPDSVIRVRMAEMNKVEETDTTKVEKHQEGCFFQITTKATSSVWCEILSIRSRTEAKVKLINPCRNNFESTEVYKASWSDDFGYPRTVDIHEERLTLAGNLANPSMVWLSQTNNWDNFRSVSNLETDPLAYNLASDSGEPISWIVSREDLMIGLGNSEWSLGSRDSGQALTQSIVKASEQSNDGVEYIAPAKIGNMLAYVRRGNKEIATITYDFASDSYNSMSLTTINPEILGGGVKCIFNQLSPRNNLFALRKDGQIAVFTYDRENNVSAWGRFTFGDGVVSACAVSNGDFRSIFLVVKRNGKLLLERLDANESADDNWRDCVPLNDSVLVTGVETSVEYTSRTKTTPIFLEGHVKIFSIQLFALSSLGGKYRVVGYNSDGEFKQDQWRELRANESELFDEDMSPRDWRYKGEVDIGFLEEASIEIECKENSGFNLCALAGKAEG